MKKAAWLATAVLWGNNAFAQDKIQQTNDLLEQLPQEKVYLLADKEQYVVGDDLQFKTFVFNGYLPTELSSMMFVELYDSDKKLLESRTLHLTKGQGAGTFHLTDNLQEGVYYLRAYTPWMSNFSQKLQEVRAIRIYNEASGARLEKTSGLEWNVKARPEGGNLIDGLPAKVAVRFLTESGTAPQQWKGFLADAKAPNQALVNFTNLDSNVATFDFTPKKGIAYEVAVEGPGGQKKKMTLPEVKTSGVQLHTQIEGDNIRYKITGKGLTEGLQGYKVVGTVNNHLAYRANIKKSNTEATSTIPQSIFGGGNGVLNLTLFNENDEPVSERLVFVKGALSTETPEVLDLPLNHNPRGFNSFDVVPKGEKTHFTALVRDAGDGSASSEFDRDNLLSTLWLTGDFSAPISDPAAYFNSDGNAQALDALMMSEKWERFDWSRTLAGDLPQIKVPADATLSFAGTVTQGGRTLVNTQINLTMTNQQGQQSFMQGVSDENGVLHIDDFVASGPVTVFYYINGQSLENAPGLKIDFKPITQQNAFTGDFPRTSYKLTQTTAPRDPAIAKAFENIKNANRVDEDAINIEAVEVTGKKKDLTQELDKELSTGLFQSINSQVFDFVNENQHADAYSNIIEWMQGKVAGLMVQRDGSGNAVPYIRNAPAKIYLDETPVDAGMIGSIPVSSIAMVKVLKNSGLLGDAIAIYTKRGNMRTAEEEANRAPATNKNVLRGYDLPKPFVLPDVMSDAYSKIKEDTRQVLYWNPDLYDDSGLLPRAKFFNNDSAKAFDILVLGVKEDGTPIYFHQIQK